MADEVLAAAARLRRLKAGEFIGDVYPGALTEAWMLLAEDSCRIVSETLTTLGMFQADDGERITTVAHAVECGGVLLDGYPTTTVFFYADNLCITWDSKTDWWQLGNARLWRDYSPTRGQLRMLLKAIGT